MTIVHKLASTKPKKPMKKTRQSTEEFLIQGAAGKRRAATAEDTEKARKVLAKKFPDILAGRKFTDAAMEKVRGEKTFSAMAVRVDPDGAKEPVMDHLVDAARELARVCGKTAGFWGVLEGGILGAVLPGKPKSKAVKAADSLRKKVRARHRGSVSVGVAVYPTADYTRPEILQNTLKALDHAEFFGPDQSVVFDAVSLNVSGDKLYQEGDLEGAMAEYERALVLDPKETNVINSLGVCHAVKGDYGRAMECFIQAKKLDKKDVMAPYNMGMIHLLAGRAKEALKLLAEAEAIEPGVFEVLLATGRAHLAKGDAATAREWLQKAVDASPTSWAGHKHLADCLVELGELKEAARSYERVLRIHPNDAPSLSALAEVYDRLGENPDIALSFSRQSVELEPDNGLFRFRLGMLYEKQGGYARALSHYLAAQELGHPCAEAIEKIKGRVLPEN
ncbi:MAG: tetratricopeptide repeat protein [Deltaproteobacteria bacterium]|nr:tetratricopeptide repeat protein [Deltaproteobacteria bacterium]